MADPKPDEPRIDVAVDGPYLVRSVERLRNSRGESIEIKRNFALCRCGGSATKPFCDGTHKTNGFKGTNEGDPVKRKAREYKGKDISIHDRRWICSHAAQCTEGLPEVWRKDDRPWITPDAADPERIIDVIRRCPSGALSYSIGGVEIQTPPTPRPPTVEIQKDGPYRVTGGPRLTDASGIEPAIAEHYVLCRCGKSKNKPFCDDSHYDAGFTDEAN